MLVILAAISLFTANAFAKDLSDAAAIVERANLAQYYAGKDGRAQIRMKIVDAQQRSRLRQFTVLRSEKKDGGDQFYLVVFEKPADVRNTTFLVKKHPQKDDDRWLYMPGLDLVKRISAGDKRTSFVGSNFFYEDISGRHHTEDTHKLKETNDQYYVIESTPKNRTGVEFAKYTLWVDKSTFLPSKIEYTNKQGKVYRRIETAQTKNIQGNPTITRLKVTDLESGAYTMSEIRNTKYDLGIPENIYTEASLRNPPSNWLK
ncbi:MAG: outer membrane lipoprotein-sorting protein [Myxococcales bacterium]|nr:MAG: outer membrane lipoprotein-sorting protein [Myxococcales bacterium]